MEGKGKTVLPRKGLRVLRGERSKGKRLRESSVHRPIILFFLRRQGREERGPSLTVLIVEACKERRSKKVLKSRARLRTI